MPEVQQRHPQAPDRPGGARGRPVMLATLDVPFDAGAVVFAVDSAVELGQRLIVANFVDLEPLPLSVMMGYDDLPYTPEMAESLAAPVRLAISLGVQVARLRVKSFRPVRAMVELVAEENAGLLVFGPDRSRIRRLRYRRAARVIRSSVTALIWLPD
ncbi:MAG TPA: universal stress protein [Streptosporangiaceae bacterium]